MSEVNASTVRNQPPDKTRARHRHRTEMRRSAGRKYRRTKKGGR